MIAAYYNEIDPYAAQWLRNLIAAGHIAPGDVDEREIQDVCPSDLAGYTQCHFFAGIGVWSHALRRAGWPDDRAVWTGSCPCQPFSVAGLGAGFNDERHLWPLFHHLIDQCRPPVVFGEQVASKDGLTWLDLVLADLEGAEYAAAAVDLCAAGVGAPHIRQRLWFVADAGSRSVWRRREYREDAGAPGQVPGEVREQRLRLDAGSIGADGSLAHSSSSSSSTGLQERIGDGRVQREALGASQGQAAQCNGDLGLLEHTGSVRRNGWEATAPGHDHDGAAPQRPEGEYGAGLAGAHRLHQDGAGPTNGHWRDADWLCCRDGKWRPVEPGTFPLAHGAPARVGRLRAYGNAIVAQAAAEVIQAYMECRP